MKDLGILKANHYASKNQSQLGDLIMTSVDARESVLV